MRTDRSYNSSLQDTSRTFQPKTLFIELSDQLAQIKKQMKTKVNRNQFISSLHTKVSTSDLAFYGIATHQNKQNCMSNFDTNVKHERDDKIFAHIEQLWKKVQQIEERDVELELRRNKQFVKEVLQKTERQQSQNKQKEFKKLAELESYVFKKADRSQLDKLFNLNELLVIEIEQAKQKTEQLSKTVNEKVSKLLNQMQAKFERIRKQNKLDYKQLENNKLQVEQLSQQIDRILDLVETKIKSKPPTSTTTTAQIVQSIQTIQDRFNDYDTDQKLILKQLTTRINVLELKQTQIFRSAKEFDQIQNYLEIIKADVLQLYQRSTQVNVNVKNYCDLTAQNIKNSFEKQVSLSLNLNCQQMVKKMISLADKLASKEQFDESTRNWKQNYRHLLSIHQDHSRKIDVLTQKQDKLYENMEQQAERTQQILSSMRKDMQQYATQKDLMSCLDKFIDVESMKQISKQISKKIDTDINKVVTDQNKINQVICSETVLAKWFWNSSTLKGGNLVCWDKQLVNTLPQNFKWNKSQPQIIISKTGYYRIQLGFYSKKKPTVQLIVNGQTIVSAVNSNSYVVHHSSGKLKDVSNNDIAGLTYIDFFMLPDNARIALSYIGQYTGEGFFSIQRI